LRCFSAVTICSDSAATTRHVAHALRDQDRAHRLVDMGQRRTLDQEGATGFGVGIAGGGSSRR